MAKLGHRNWLEEREEWEGGRALYELELQTAFDETSNRRARLLMGAFACHAITTALITGWLAFLGFAFAIIGATILIWHHSLENSAERKEMKEKLEMKFPEKLTPGPAENK